MIHALAVSGGKDSTAMALRLAELEPREYVPFCTPTGDEPDEWFEHLKLVGSMIGTQIIPIVHPLGLNGLIAEQKCLPNWQKRFCTRMLKIEPCIKWLEKVAPATLYVGLRADEDEGERPGGDYSEIPGVTVRCPMREWGWGVHEVWEYLVTKGFRHPSSNPLFDDPNAKRFPKRTDCKRCFFQTLYEWYELWRDDPITWADAERQEAEIGHTFRSDSRDTWPAGLAGMRKEFESGRVPKERRRDALKALQCRTCTL